MSQQKKIEFIPATRDEEYGHQEVPEDLEIDPIYALAPDVEAAFDLTAAATAFPVDTALPNQGDGFYGYLTAPKRFGIAAAIEAVVEVARIWSQRRPGGPFIGVGNISKEGGGPLPPHSSHQLGRDIDVRPMRNDGVNGPVTISQSAYSRSLTQELVDLFDANAFLLVRRILFNDSGVQGVGFFDGHDNHLHISLRFPNEGNAPPTLRNGSNRPAVRECQRRINFWIADSGAQLTPIAVDGDFGGQTDSAVIEFQRANNLDDDGVVGEQTWPTLPVE
ncbi:MAG: penicillin-insensitive murein endopeptidase [Verrucomicrobiota bacterium]